MSCTKRKNTKNKYTSTFQKKILPAASCSPSGLQGLVEEVRERFRFDEGASAEAKLALIMPSEEEKGAKPQRVAEGRGSEII